MARPLASRQRAASARQATRPGLLASAAALVVVALLSAGGPTVNAAAKTNEYIEDTDRFPGWKGELPQQQPLGSDPVTIGYGESGKVSGNPAACRMTC